MFVQLEREDIDEVTWMDMAEHISDNTQIITTWFITEGHIYKQHAEIPFSYTCAYDVNICTHIPMHTKMY